MEILCTEQFESQIRAIRSVKDRLYSSEFRCTCAYLVTDNEVARLASDFTRFEYYTRNFGTHVSQVPWRIDATPNTYLAYLLVGKRKTVSNDYLRAINLFAWSFGFSRDDVSQIICDCVPSYCDSCMSCVPARVMLKLFTLLDVQAL